MTKAKIKKETSKVVSASTMTGSKHKIVKSETVDSSLPFEVTDYHKKALLKLLFCHHSGQNLTYLELSDEIGAGAKTKAWQGGAWKDLKTQEYIVPSPTNSKGKTQFMLSEKGITLASTFASDEELADYKMPETNEEHHAKIKSKLAKQEKAKKFGPKIFDLLVREDYASMNKHEIAAKFNTLADSHGFFYGLQALKKMGLVVEDTEAASSATPKGKPKRKAETPESKEGGEGDGTEKSSQKKKKNRSGGKPLKLSEKAFLATTRA